MIPVQLQVVPLQFSYIQIILDDQYFFHQTPR
jgi:hypothetical protein